MNLPDDFIIRTRPLLKDQWDNFVEALAKEAPTSIRLNKSKYISEMSMQKVPWCDTGYYLEQRPQFTFDPLFHMGNYYVQEASSMFITQILKQHASPDARILDLCAAPGGKSTLIADYLNEEGLLVSNEIIRSRAYILSENITKWGIPNTIVTNNDPLQIGKLKGFFDAILVDAPCSGEGMFRKDEGAIAEWSVDNVKLCKERQQKILADIWPALKEDGILIYSTCTYNTEENEQNVQWIRDELDADILSVETEKEWDITSSVTEDVSAYRFFPHKTKGEGFFCAVLKKKGEEYGLEKTKSKEKNKTVLPSEYQNYIFDKNNFVFYQDKNNWCAFPLKHYDDLQTIKSYLTTISEGICLGEFKGKDFIPHQSLAQSIHLNINAFTHYEADQRTSIAYLRKEPVVLEDMPKGYVLLTYQNKPLGFVKNIGNRANNLYPQEWRIRSANIPSQFDNPLP